jgi:hypothetical protein
VLALLNTYFLWKERLTKALKRKVLENPPRLKSALKRPPFLRKHRF